MQIGKLNLLSCKKEGCFLAVIIKRKVYRRMTDGMPATQNPEFKYCKTGLVVYGIFTVLLGIGCVLIAALLSTGMIMQKFMKGSASVQLDIGMAIASVLVFVLMAMGFIWLGIGSCKALRWARSLLLTISWIYLVLGTLGVFFQLVLMSEIYGQMVQKGQLSPELVFIIKLITFGVMTGFFVIIPGAYVLYFGRKNVKATCEYRDPKVRWTDQCPLPVLAVSLIFGSWASSMLLMGFYGWATPFFGVILNGPAGALVVIFELILFSYIAWGTYKMDIRAWWCAILTFTFWGISMIMTFSRLPLSDLFETMNYPQTQLDMMKDISSRSMPAIAWMFAFSSLAYLGYLVYVRKFFFGAARSEG